jgi:protein arginine kinase activator
MLCQDCQENEATVPFIQIVDGKKTVHHLCVSCAEKRSGGGGSVTVTLSGILAEDEDPEEAEAPDLTCAFCGLTYAEFKKAGRFGCDGCFVAFGSELDEVFKRIHGASRHAEAVAGDLEDLRKALQKAVASENFEEAARLRDRIAAARARGAGVKT